MYVDEKHQAKKVDKYRIAVKIVGNKRY